MKKTVRITAIWLLAFACNSLLSQTTYDDVAGEVGLLLTHTNGDTCDAVHGSGSAWADIDNDGDVDFFVTNSGGANRLYLNEGDLNSDLLPDFREIAAAAGISDPEGVSHSAVFIDYDNDGDQDLYVTNWDGNRMFRNQLIETGKPSFADVTDITGLENGGRAITTAWADFDLDGDLDVYLAKHRYCPDFPSNQDHLYENNGDGTFSDASYLFCPDGADPCPQLMGLAFSAAWFDYDNDADLDLYVANENRLGGIIYYPNVLWRNDGPDTSGLWGFTDVSLESETQIYAKPMGLAVADYDNDGWMDIAFSNTGPNYLLRNQGDGTFEDVSEAAGILRDYTPAGDGSVTWGTVFFDHDNDGLQDLYLVAGAIHTQQVPQPNALFRNQGDGTFLDASFETGLDDSLRGRAASIVDFDEDGFVDVFVGNLFQQPKLFHNRSALQGNTNHWLKITVEGTSSNRDAIGTRLWLVTPDDEVHMREINSGPTYGGGDYRAAFWGLGAHDNARLYIRWPGGIVQDLGGIFNIDRHLHLVEPDSADPQIVNTLTIEPDSGDGTFTYQMTFLNTTDTGQRSDLWTEANGPDGYEDLMFSAFKIFGAHQTITKSSSYTIPGESPDGVYTISLKNGVYPHVVEQVVTRTYVKDAGGAVSAAGSSASLEGTVDQFVLYQNHPNPFNPSTRVAFGIRLPAGHEGNSEWVTLKIFDLGGRLVRTLVHERMEPGLHQVEWNGRDETGRAVASGTYFYRLTAGQFASTRSMLLIR